MLRAAWASRGRNLPPGAGAASRGDPPLGSRAEIEYRRSRLFIAVFLVLAGFASLSVVFSFLGADALVPLQLTPTAARAGVLLLTLAFIALVWEKERQFRQWSEEITHQQVLTAGFESRLQVLEGLLEASDKLNAPLTVNEVLKVLLQAAVELAGAEHGSVEFIDDEGAEVSLAQTHSTGAAATSAAGVPGALRIPLCAGDKEIGVLSLVPPPGSDGFDAVTREVLQRFAKQAAGALEKARLMARERASLAYREAANVVKSRFLTTVSHELRTPLTSIIGYSSTLGNHWSRLRETQKREFVGEIETQAKRLARLIERILEAARVELRGVVVEPVDHDVTQTLRETLAPFVVSHPERLQLALPERPVEAKLDPKVLDAIVSNLVDNALRYSEGPVRLSLDGYRNSVLLTVVDRGPGIDPKQLKLVLEPLYRIDENVQSGTGLGLHIVRTLVEAHGGRGEIRTGPTGTSITIRLPRETPDAGAETERDAGASAGVGMVSE